MNNERINRRILLLSTAYLPELGGSELAIKNITDRLSEYTFDLITAQTKPAEAKEEKIGNVTVYRVGGFFSLSRFLLPKAFLPISITWRAWRLERSRHYDIIHAYQASQAAGAGWILKFLFPRTPFLLTLQEGKDLARQNILIRFFRKCIIVSADYFTAISGYLERYIQGGRPNAIIRRIPNGVGDEFFYPAETSNSTRSQLGIAPDVRVVLSISRLVPKNGIDRLLSAAAQLKGRFPIKVLLAGRGELAEDLKKQADRLGIGEDVIFLGSVSPARVPSYLSVADVFVRPSQSEGLGTAFLEAMAAGVPVVGPELGGITDFLRHQETGLICNANDPTDIAAHIKRLFIDTELRKHLISNARELVRAKYTWDIVAEQMRDMYKMIIQKQT